MLHNVTAAVDNSQKIRKIARARSIYLWPAIAATMPPPPITNQRPGIVDGLINRTLCKPVDFCDPMGVEAIQQNLQTFSHASILNRKKGLRILDNYNKKTLGVQIRTTARKTFLFCLAF